MADGMVEQAPQEQMQGAPAEGGADTFLQDLGQGLQTLGEMVQATPDAPPEAMQMVEQIMSMYEQLIQTMSGGGAPQDQGPQAVPVDQPEGTPV